MRYCICNGFIRYGTANRYAAAARLQFHPHRLDSNAPSAVVDASMAAVEDISKQGYRYAWNVRAEGGDTVTQ
jgi:hypothetical protein